MMPVSRKASLSGAGLSKTIGMQSKTSAGVCPLASNDLSKEEVKRLVYAYSDHGVTDELYSFGLMLLNEIGQRSTQIDSKAAMTLGWSTGILAFLFVNIEQTKSNLNLAISFMGGACALIAVILSFAALRVYNEWEWPSDRDWLEETGFIRADELRRFHIRSLHEVRHNHKEIVGRKASRLLWGQSFLAFAGMLLALGIAIRTLLAFGPVVISFFKFIGVSIGIP